MKARPGLTSTLEKILAQRTRYLCVVVEDLYQPHNGAAVIRACERFGIQDLHVISNRNPFQVSPEVAGGARQWITVHQTRETKAGQTPTVLGKLKEQGYRIACTTLREGAIPIAELPLDHKIALCFGTEELGLSEEAHTMADYFVHIPMLGFTQSFNISVSAAICLFELSSRLKETNLPWQLTEAEKSVLRARWTAKLATNGDEPAPSG